MTLTLGIGLDHARKSSGLPGDTFLPDITTEALSTLTQENEIVLETEGSL